MPVSRRHAISFLGTLLALPAFASLGSAPPWLWSSPSGSEFLAAVCRGDAASVRSMLSADPSLARAKDPSGRSAFVLANVNGHEGIAALLLGMGPELDLVESILAEDWERFDALVKANPELLNSVHPIGGTPMYAAALYGSLDFWRLRLADSAPGASVVGSSGFTPVRGALESPRAAWARISLTDLCANGSDINEPQKGGSSVLHGAVLRRDEILVRLAIRKGAAVDARDDQGRTAQDLAKQLGWEDGVQLLAKHPSLVRDNRNSRFALNASREPIVFPDLSDVSRARQGEVTSNSHGNLNRVRELVSKDTRLVFSISSDDELAIEACAHTGKRSIIRYHLDHGAPLSLPTAVSLGDEASVDTWLQSDPSLAHERGAHDFPLMWFALLGGAGVSMAELLVSHGASVDQESMGTTTLHHCARRGNTDLAKFLIEAGADPEAQGFKWSRHGETPLQVASAADSTKLVSLLKAAGAKR